MVEHGNSQGDHMAPPRFGGREGGKPVLVATTAASPYYYHVHNVPWRRVAPFGSSGSRGDKEQGTAVRADVLWNDNKICGPGADRGRGRPAKGGCGGGH